MATKKLAEIIKEQISKHAYIKTIGPYETELVYDDIELVINGKKTKCGIGMDVEYTVDIDEASDDLREFVTFEGVDYSITTLRVDIEDGTIFTEEQEEKILEENRTFLEDYIAHDMDNIAEGHIF